MAEKFGFLIVGEVRRVLYFWHFVGNKFLTLLSNMFTNLNLTDMESGFKVFKRDLLQRFRFQENHFRFEPEVTGKVAKLGASINEVAVSYGGRTYAPGKSELARRLQRPPLHFQIQSHLSA